jgi:cell division septation protein DedD
MRLTKIVFRLLIVLIAAKSISFGQDSQRSWFIIQDDVDKIVYIDTSNISLTDNQLFVRSIIMYREPVFMHTLQKNVKKSKSHLLFDTQKKTYSIIGAVFYDIEGNVVGQSDDVAVTSGAKNYSLKIQQGSIYELIMDKAMEYLTTNRISVVPSSYLMKKSEEIISKVDSIENERIKEVRKQEEPSKIAVKSEVQKPKLPKPPEVKEEKKPEKTLNKKYDASKERIVKSLIYSDGSTYCFQVSSWKRENVAKQEVERLKRKGYDAFYVQANIPGRGTWYRVRVGYFDTIEEASKYQKIVK